MPVLEDAAKQEVSVLLVEHDPQAAQLLLLLLAAPHPELRRFEPTRVEDVERGLLALARRDPVDAVLLGLPLPGGRTSERLRALRRRAPGVPIVALIEPGAEALGREALALGAHAFVVKGRMDCRALKRSLGGVPVPSRS
jgi:DNA-binding NarL/FixJ family response regulator